MSKTRGGSAPFGYKLRSEKYLYQASDSEIRADLEKLNYSSQVKKLQDEQIVETILPKKREAPVEDLDYVVDGLVKLMTFKPKEQKKKPVTIVEKKSPPPPVQTAPSTISTLPVPQNPPNYPMSSMYSLFSLHNNFGISDMPLYSQPFFYSALGMNNIVQIRSSADCHLKLARYIKTHKLNVNH
ncbi:hypothetical protein SteCoe_27468 [Stentor coeruleus]|uniref:Uncharacterized protein n=1 Tax=Stentor coeruleus TaxID=5963 RepID=A0A1R2BAG9_9CILI|nr:hypothetical protein SteCoe_27468 [Stentor coeruleus]